MSGSSHDRVIVTLEELIHRFQNHVIYSNILSVDPQFAGFADLMLEYAHIKSHGGTLRETNVDYIGTQLKTLFGPAILTQLGVPTEQNTIISHCDGCDCEIDDEDDEDDEDEDEDEDYDGP